MTLVNDDNHNNDNSILFNKVFKNIFIKSKIIKFLCTYGNIDYYYLYQDREGQLTTKEIKQYQDYFDEIREYKLEFKIYNYNEINDLEWIIKNKYYSLLYDKLIMSTRSTKLTTTIKVTEDSIYKFCEFNSNFKLFKLFYSIYGNEHFCKENTRIIQKTVQSGSLEIVKYLVVQGFKFDYESLRFATSYGYLEILKYLVDSNSSVSFKDNIVDFVRVDPIDVKRVDQITGREYTEVGHNIGLDIAKYLKQVKPEIKFTPIAIDYACISGNIDMVKYYQNEISNDNHNIGLKVSKQGLIGAIVGNHIELLKYLLIDGNLSNVESTIFGSISISYGIDQAILKGHIESVKYIYYNLSGSKWSIIGIENAAKYNHIDILKFIFSVDLETLLSNNKNYSIVDSSTKSNNLQLVQYLYEIGFKKCSFKSIYNSTKRNNFEIVKFIYSNYSSSTKLFSFKSLKISIKNENIQLFNYLIQQEPNIVNLINNCGITNNIKSSVLYEICIIKKNCTLLKLVMDTLKQHNITIPFRKESLLSLAIQNSHLETIEFLLSLPGFKITPSLILLSNNKKIAFYLYNEFINNTSTILLNYSIIIENKSILSNVNLIKFHLKYQKHLNNLISNNNNQYNGNNNILLSEKEILLSASIENNLNVLKYIFKKNNCKLFSFDVLREAILSNSLENVIFILENLDLTTITSYPIIDSSINNLEILQYLHSFDHVQFKATTNAIDEATSLNQYMTVLFLLKNRNEGFTKQALLNSESKFPSIYNLLNNHIHLLNKNE